MNKLEQEGETLVFIKFHQTKVTKLACCSISTKLFLKQTTSQSNSNQRLNQYTNQANFPLLSCRATKNNPAAPRARNPLALCNLTHRFIPSTTPSFFSSSISACSLLSASTALSWLLVGIIARQVQGMIDNRAAAPYNQKASLVFQKAQLAAAVPRITILGIVFLPSSYILSQCWSCSFFEASCCLTMGSSSDMQKAGPAKRRAKVPGAAKRSQFPIFFIYGMI